MIDHFKNFRHFMYRGVHKKGFQELWQTWKERWGEKRAGDAVIAAMADFEARYQDLKETKELHEAMESASPFPPMEGQG